VVTDESYRGLAVNLAGIGFIDSTGVGIWHRTRATQGCLALAAPSRRAQAVLPGVHRADEGAPDLSLPDRGRAGMPRGGRPLDARERVIAGDGREYSTGAMTVGWHATDPVPTVDGSVRQAVRRLEASQP
jgi:hypothetical protein